jgi:multidrug transporter EmrE-like cation transporter
MYLGCYLVFSVVFFDKVVRNFRVIQIVRVVTGITVVKVTMLHSN